MGLSEDLDRLMNMKPTPRQPEGPAEGGPENVNRKRLDVIRSLWEGGNPLNEGDICFLFRMADQRFAIAREGAAMRACKFCTQAIKQCYEIEEAEHCKHWIAERKNGGEPLSATEDTRTMAAALDYAAYQAGMLYSSEIYICEDEQKRIWDQYDLARAAFGLPPASRG